MNASKTTLVMAGSREAHGIVAGLVDRGESVVASLPERERSFEPLVVPTRTGAFASPDIFAEWLEETSASKVIDAGHPFDADLSNLVRRYCASAGLPYVRVLRPAWKPMPSDQWINVSSVRDGVEAAPQRSRLFSNTGWLSLPDYAGFRGEHVFLRQAHPVTQSSPYPFLTLLPGEPPFSVVEEARLFDELRISHLICRNVGGDASATKLIAARELGLPVFMVRRPHLPPDCPRVKTVEEALSWSDTA